jgi:hypothetical protein
LAPGKRLAEAGIIVGTAYLIWSLFGSKFSAEPDHIESGVITPLTNLAVDLSGFTLGLVAPVTGHLARGLRNNNPGNIRASNDAWVGKVAVDDAGYIVFDTMAHGIRAMTIILRNYANRYGANTVNTIIRRWAPSIENDTESYIRDVSRRLGVSPDEYVPVTAALIEAIIIHENGYNPISLAEIDAGIALA